MDRHRVWQVILLCSWTSYVFCLFAPMAMAQTAHSVTSEADALFTNAKALMDKKRYAEACPLLEKARESPHGIGLIYHLADCHKHIGRTASAWAGFRDAAAAADIEGLQDRAEDARKRAAALVPHLSLLRIVVPADAATVPDLQVQRDGIPIHRLLWNKSIPVDPGTHVISATAPGRELWNTSVVVNEPGAVIAIDVPVLKPAQSKHAINRLPQNGSSADTVSGSSAFRTGIVTGSAVVSAVALEIAVGFTMAANGQASHVRAIRSTLADASACYGKPAQNIERTCTALREMGAAWDIFENAAITSYVVSGVTAGGAIATYLLWPKRRSTRGTLVLPWLTPHAVGTSIGGEF